MITAVIPLYNELDNCLDFTNRLAAQLSLYGRWEMILMVGGTDGTYELLAGVWNDERVKIYYEKERGLGTAIINGFRLVDPHSDWVLTMDADGQNLPEEIPKLMAKTNYNFERGFGTAVPPVVVGEHTHLEDARPWKKRMISKTINWCLSKFYGTEVSDHTSNFRLYWGPAVLCVRDVLVSKDYEIQPEILIRMRRAGFSIGEAYINFPPRKGGESKLRFRSALIGYVRLVWRLGL